MTLKTRSPQKHTNHDTHTHTHIHMQHVYSLSDILISALAMMSSDKVSDEDHDDESR